MSLDFDRYLPEEDPTVLVREGHQLWQEGQKERAIVIFKKAEQLNPEYTNAWINLTFRTNILKQPREISTTTKPLKSSKINFSKAAINLCDKLIEFDSNNYLAWYLEGDALLEINQYPEAIACYKQAISIDPFLSSGWPARVTKLKNLQLKTEAIEVCSAVFYALKEKIDNGSLTNSYYQKKFKKTWVKLEEILLKLKQE